MIKCRQNHPVTVYKLECGTSITWTRSNIVSIEVANENLKFLSRNTWIFPEKLNQGCFDALFYHKKGVIDVIQITKSQG